MAKRELVFIQQPKRVQIPNAIVPPVIVEVRLDGIRDSSIIDGEVTMQVGSGPPGGSIVGTSAARCPGGRATFDDLRFNVPGTYTLKAECDEDSLVFASEGRRVAITVPSGRVGAFLAGFPLFVDLALLPQEIWDEAKPDGGDLRARSASGDLIPMDLVRYEPSAKAGALFVRLDLSPDQDTTFYLHWGNPDDERLPVDHPAGRHAVWAGFHRVVLADASLEDRTGQGVAAGSIAPGPTLFEPISTSPNLGVHQGIECDGTFFYGTDTNGIRKFDRNWNLIAENTDPCGQIGHGVNHIGDPVWHDGKLYVPAEDYQSINVWSKMRIAVFDAETLALINSYDISAQNHEASGCCIGPDGYIYVTSYADGSKLWKYDRDTMAFVGTLPLSTNLTLLQGITFWRGAFWVNSYAGSLAGTRTYRVETDGTVKSGPIWSWPTGVGEGITHDDETLFVLIDPDGQSNGVAHRIRPINFEAGGGILCVPHPGSTPGAGCEVDAQPSDTVTIGCSMVMLSKAQRAIASYAAESTSLDRMTLVVRMGTSDSIGLWDRINLWFHPTPEVIPELGTRYRVHAVYNGSAWRKLFIDGIGHQQSGITPLTAISGIDSFRMGGATSATTVEQWHGYLGYGYVRLEALSDEWIAAECANLANPGDFFAVGEPEHVGGTP